MAELVLSHSPSIAIAKEIDGLEMGVLNDGRSYMTGRSLARLCGVAPSTIINQAERWLTGDRNNKLAGMLVARGLERPSLYETLQRAGKKVHAYPDDICSAILEYYAFEATPPSDTALGAFRKLAQAGLRVFIYKAVDYDPQRQLAESWRHFHDRLEMHAVPSGYFSVFREGADFVIASIRAGLPNNPETIPDISIGKLWSIYWVENKLAATFGERTRHEHNYPDDYPQAKSNPQEIWVYPVDALGAFRRWVDNVYLPTKYPNYLSGQVKKGRLAPAVANLLAKAVVAPQLGAGGSR